MPTQSLQGKGSTLAVNFMHITSPIFVEFSYLEITYSSRVMPMIARGFGNYGAPCSYRN